MDKKAGEVKSVHRTVLLNEAIEGLNLGQKSKETKGNSVIVDGTFGGGGHSFEICKKYPDTKIIALDQDESVFEKAQGKLSACNISFRSVNFRDLDQVLVGEGIEKVGGIILDLGLSSDQLEHSGRGFSFQRDEPLGMTMKENPGEEDTTAFDVVNTWSEESLADVIYGYGEERYARRIARKIAEKRKEKRIETTFELSEVIRASVPKAYARGKLHPATKTFQAIRIAVNDELGALSEGLTKGFDALNAGGRMSVISFHSLEDRIVKKFYKEKEKKGEAILINKKPIVPTVEEIKNNPRSRSAKLRVLEKI